MSEVSVVEHDISFVIEYDEVSTLLGNSPGRREFTRGRVLVHAAGIRHVRARHSHAEVEPRVFAIAAASTGRRDLAGSGGGHAGTSGEVVPAVLEPSCSFSLLASRPSSSLLLFPFLISSQPPCSTFPAFCAVFSLGAGLERASFKSWVVLLHKSSTPFLTSGRHTRNSLFVVWPSDAGVATGDVRTGCTLVVVGYTSVACKGSDDTPGTSLIEVEVGDMSVVLDGTPNTSCVVTPLSS
ncbi:uncharacterized protein B0H18DRAFT_953731 [Fomitopsis serialis]|uniref:uncharacterized protein n=1 Tax=Fomitopsis serialis TaxID=139415 RepID=UPI0020080646|nr:uncharacterized protein B0H18DRAFT_953731 [Neoantrodia serialis]KAH9929282.1 hypothetical protein B0H18DRAFT_953731 [Neoantrodia serialis]